MEEKESLGSIDFLDVIVADAEETAKRILQDAEKTIAVKNDSAREEMAKWEAFFADKTEQEKRRIEKNSRNNLEMENRREELTLREQIISESIQKAMTKVKEFAQTPEYQKVLRHLLTEAVYGIGKTDLVVSISALEAPIITQSLLDQWGEELSKEIGATIRLELASLRLRKQGISVSDREGRMVYDNQFETRLIRYQSPIRKAVSQVLSGS